MKLKTDCMYEIPHELSGIGSVCGLLRNNCNGYGKHCLAYRKHTKESRQALEKALAEVKAVKEATDGKSH